MTVSKQIGLAAIFCVGPIFVFCRLINKNIEMVSTKNV